MFELFAKGVAVAGALYGITYELGRRRRKKSKRRKEEEEEKTPVFKPHVWEKPEEPGPELQTEEAPTPAQPADWHARFQTWYRPMADDCIARSDVSAASLDIAVDALAACTLEAIFPEAMWPPPEGAHQWQRNLMPGTYGDPLRSYIEGKLQVPGVPG